MVVERRAFLPLTTEAAGVSWLGVAGCTRRRFAHAGEVIARQGESASRYSVIETGAIVAFAGRPDGQRTAIELLGPGDGFGQEALPIDQTDVPIRPEFVTLVPTHFLTVSSDELWTLIGRRPDLARSLVVSLARRMQRLHRHLERSLALRVPDRVMELLSELSERCGRQVAGGVLIDLPLTQELLASLVGATRESVNRAVRELRRRGRLRGSGRRYIVPVAGSFSSARANEAPDPAFSRTPTTSPSRSSLSR